MSRRCLTARLAASAGSIAVALSLASPARATVIQINFVDNNTDGLTTTTSIAGTTWNQVTEKSNGAPYPNIADLRDSANALTGIGLTWTDGTHFAANTAGEGGNSSTSGVTYDGKFFPWTVVDSYNATHVGSDGLAALRFESSTQLAYTFWVMSSRDSANPPENQGWYGLYNVGGTYNKPTQSFTGGTTLALNATKQQGPDDQPDGGGDTTLKYDVGKLSILGGFHSTYDSGLGKFVLTFQAGDGSSTASYGMAINGLIVEAVPIPEPAALGLLALGGLVMLPRRRRS